MLAAMSAACGRKDLTAERIRSPGTPDAVEMECAAVAQVCKMYSLPFLGLRALSDTLEGDANADFNAFCQEAADNLYPVVSHVVANV